MACDSVFVDSFADIEAIDRDINAFIMDYLVTEGYPNAAKKFALEAGIPSSRASRDTSVEIRRDIRLDILRGNVESAISKIVDYNPAVSSTPFLNPLSLK